MADLKSRKPLIYDVPTTADWYRSHQVCNHPVFFGKSASCRWDAPKGEYGVLYLAGDQYCAFMESIGRGVLKSQFVPEAELKRKGLSLIRFTRPLRLIDMVSTGGLTRLGTEASLSSGTGYGNSQRWSKALREHPTKPDGIYYYSRHDPARVACALYEVCEPFIEVVGPCEAWADKKVLLGAILDQYGFATDL